jgi:hypothetical protein
MAAGPPGSAVTPGRSAAGCLRRPCRPAVIERGPFRTPAGDRPALEPRMPGRCGLAAAEAQEPREPPLPAAGVPHLTGPVPRPPFARRVHRRGLTLSRSWIVRGSSPSRPGPRSPTMTIPGISSLAWGSRRAWRDRPARTRRRAERSAPHRATPDPFERAFTIRGGREEIDSSRRIPCVPQMYRRTRAVLTPSGPKSGSFWPTRATRVCSGRGSSGRRGSGRSGPPGGGSAGASPAPFRNRLRTPPCNAQ